MQDRVVRYSTRPFGGPKALLAYLSQPADRARRRRRHLGRHPLGAKAIGDFAEGDARAQRPLGSVVCRRNVLVGDEDAHVAADFLDHATLL